MQDKEIIKALVCCSNQTYFCSDEKCHAKTLGDAIDLINRQKAEIIKLKNKNSKLRNERNRARADAVKEFAERLKAKFDKYGVDYTAYTMGDDIVREMGVEQ